MNAFNWLIRTHMTLENYWCVKFTNSNYTWAGRQPYCL